MTSRDLIFVSVGTLLGGIGIAASFLGRDTLGMIALFLLGLLILFLMILQRRTQARVQERILYLVKAENKRSKIGGANSSASTPSTDSNAVLAKKVVGLLQAQQISMERLRRELSGESD